MPLRIRHAHFVQNSHFLAVLDDHNKLLIVDGDMQLAEEISLMLRDERPLQLLAGRDLILVLTTKSSLLLHVYDSSTLHEKREPIKIADCGTGSLGFLSSSSAAFVLVLSGRSLVHFNAADFSRQERPLDHDYERLETSLTSCFLVSATQIAKVSKQLGSDQLQVNLVWQGSSFEAFDSEKEALVNFKGERVTSWIPLSASARDDNSKKQKMEHQETKGIKHRKLSEMAAPIVHPKIAFEFSRQALTGGQVLEIGEDSKA